MTGEGADFRRELEDQLPDLSAPERRAAFLGLLQERLPDEVDAVLVGGGLVELLTEGTYVTGDLDVVGNPDTIGSLLEGAGFERTGRHFLDEELGLTVEIVSPALDPGRQTERIRWRGFTLVVLSLEDLIVDRLCAAKFWGSDTDREQASIVLEAHRERVDDERLRERAEEEQVLDLLEELGAPGS